MAKYYTSNSTRESTKIIYYSYALNSCKATEDQSKIRLICTIFTIHKLIPICTITSKKTCTNTYRGK